MLLSVLSLPTFSQVIDFIEMMKSSRAQHAFRLQRRFPGHPVITAQLADLFGVSFVSFVSAHKNRFPGNRGLRFEEARFECRSIDVRRPSLGGLWISGASFLCSWTVAVGFVLCVWLYCRVFRLGPSIDQEIPIMRDNAPGRPR